MDCIHALLTHVTSASQVVTGHKGRERHVGEPDRAGE